MDRHVGSRGPFGIRRGSYGDQLCGRQRGVLGGDRLGVYLGDGVVISLFDLLVITILLTIVAILHNFRIRSLEKKIRELSKEKK
jgi:hypothetical protein